MSHFISGKLYKYFAYQKIDPTVVEGMAQTFVDNNWEILPVLKQLIKSEHFFEESTMNSQLKNPLETMLCLLKNASATSAQVPQNWWNAIFYWSYQLGQEIFNPPNVAGWKGHRNWINESTLTGRWNYSTSVAYFLTLDDTLKENLRTLAQQALSDSAKTALAWAHTARFLTTASQLEHLPQGDMGEIAFVGRSNAGKSTAINTRRSGANWLLPPRPRDAPSTSTCLRWAPRTPLTPTWPTCRVMAMPRWR